MLVNGMPKNCNMMALISVTFQRFNYFFHIPVITSCPLALAVTRAPRPSEDNTDVPDSLQDSNFYFKQSNRASCSERVILFKISYRLSGC